MTSTSNHRAGRSIAMAAFLPAFLFAVSSQVASAAESASQAAPTAAVKVERPSVDRVEARIADLLVAGQIVYEGPPDSNLQKLLSDNPENVHITQSIGGLSS